MMPSHLWLLEPLVLNPKRINNRQAKLGVPPKQKLKIVINTYKYFSICVCWSAFIVDEQVKDIFEKHNCNVEFHPVKIKGAYRVPVVPGSFVHEKYTDESIMGPFLYPKHAYRKNRVSVPRGMKYYEMAMARVSPKLHVDKGELKKCDMNGENWDSVCSPRLAKEHGIYRSHGFFVTDTLFEDLHPFLPSPYFVHSKVD